MDPILRFLETVDTGGLFVLVLALLFIGNRLSAAQLRVRALSLSVAAVLFVAFVAFHLTQRSAYADNLSDLTIRGLLGAGFVLGVLWIVLPPLAALFRTTTGSMRNWGREARFRRDARRRERELEAERRRHERQEPAAAKERERLRQQAAEQTRKAATDQKRREDARAKCDVLFALHGPELRERFTKEMFDDFIRRHLGDDRSADYVEQRARELCEIVQKHLEMVNGSTQELGELAAARQEVQAFYDQHADLLHEVCPPVRLKAELRARIPDTITAAAAWKEASSLIADLLQLVAQERQKNRSRQEPARPINPPLKNI